MVRFVLALLLLLMPAYADDLSSGYAKMAAGDVEAARELFLKARREEGVAAMAWRGLGLLAAEGDQKALDALNDSRKEAGGQLGLGFYALTRAAKQTPADPALLSEAQAAFTAAITADSSMKLAYAGLGEALRLSGRLREAVAAFEQGLPLKLAEEGLAAARADWVAKLAAAPELGVPVLALNAAFHTALDQHFTKVANENDPTIATRGRDFAARLQPWLSQHGDTCGQGIAAIWQGLIELRLEGGAAARTRIDEGRSTLSGCADSEARMAWAWWARSRAELQSGTLFAAEEAIRSSMTFYEAKNDQAGIARARLQTGWVLLAQGKPGDAATPVQTALSIAHQSRDAALEAEARLALGTVLLGTGQPGPARAAFKEAHAAFDKQASDLGVIDASIGEAAALRLLGEPGPALSLLDAATRIAEDVGDTHRQARVGLEWGRLYLTMNQPDRALPLLTEARAKFTSSGDQRHAADATLEQGRAMARSPDSARVIAEAVEQYQQLGDSAGEGAALIELSRSARARGDVAGATEALLKAQAALQRADRPTDAVGRELALLDPDEAKIAAAGVPLPPPPAPDRLLALASFYRVTPTTPGATLLELAAQQWASGDRARAYDSVVASLNAGVEPSAPAALLLARLRAEQGGAAGATSALSAVLSTSLRADALLQLGQLQRDQAQLQEALTLYTDARDEAGAARAMLALGRLQNDPAVLADARVRLERAGDTRSAVDAQLALLTLSAADAATLKALPARLDALRLDGLALDPRWLAPLRAAARTLSDAGDADAAFRVLELTDGLAEADWLEFHTLRTAQTQPGGVTNEAALFNLDDAWKRLEALDPTLDAVRAARLAGTLSAADTAPFEARAYAALDQLGAAYRALLSPGQTMSTPSLATVQQSLAELDRRGGGPTVLLAYHDDGAELLIRVVDANGMRLLRAPTTDLAGQVARVRAALANPKAQLPTSDLSALYQLLLAPAQLPAGARLLIVPDGPLWGLPWAALMSSPPTAKSPEYLIQAHSVTLLPGATWLVRHRAPDEGEVNDPLQVLTFAADSAGYDAPTAAAAAALLTPSLDADTNVVRCDSGGGDCKRGDRSELLSLATGEYDVMYLAVAGDERSGDLSRLQIGAEPLWTHRIHHTLTWTDLLLLPSVQADSPDAALGLARAFLCTRVRSVVSSLWRAEPTSWAGIVAPFSSSYAKNLQADEGAPFAKAEALRAAMLATLQQSATAHPAFWAGYALVGAPN